MLKRIMLNFTSIMASPLVWAKDLANSGVAMPLQYNVMPINQSHHHACSLCLTNHILLPTPLYIGIAYCAAVILHFQNIYGFSCIHCISRLFMSFIASYILISNKFSMKHFNLSQAKLVSYSYNP